MKRLPKRQPLLHHQAFTRAPMLIHIKRNEEVFGPYPTKEARGYLSTGRLTAADFAQLEGTSEWIQLASVLGIRSAPPPPVMGSGLALSHEQSCHTSSLARASTRIEAGTTVAGLLTRR